MTRGQQRPPFRTTRYFDTVVRRRHPESNRFDWVSHVLQYPVEQTVDPLHPERIRLFGYIAERDRHMRVVVEPDGSVHNAFFDRNYTATRRRGTP